MAVFSLERLERLCDGPQPYEEGVEKKYSHCHTSKEGSYLKNLILVIRQPYHGTAKPCASGAGGEHCVGEETWKNPSQAGSPDVVAGTHGYCECVNADR